MPKTYPYQDIGYTYPAPAFNIRLENLVNRRHEDNILAIIDTGADGCSISEEMIWRLQLESDDFIEEFDYEEGSHGDKRIYKVRVVINGIPFDVEATEILGRRFIIGRNLLNQVKLLLDGPKLKFRL